MTEEVYTRDEEKSLKVGLWVALSIILIVGLISSARQKITHVDSGSYGTFQPDGRFAGGRFGPAGRR